MEATQNGIEQYKKEVGMMNLEKIIQEREYISTKTFPISDEELLSRYEQLYTGAVNDVLREFCLMNQALPNRIVPLREYRTVAGFAFTVKSAPNAMLSGEMEFRVKMLDAMHENSFVIWDTSRDEKGTQWGGVMTATATGKGIKAACIDGVLAVPRDIAYEVLLRAEEIKENEKLIFGWVKDGESVQSITEKGGYF